MAEFTFEGTKEDYNRDKHILSICEILTSKGYETKFSCEGHDDDLSATVSDDGFIYVAFDAYILFKKKYHLNNLPINWVEDDYFKDKTCIRYMDMQHRLKDWKVIDGVLHKGVEKHSETGTFRFRKATPEEMNNESLRNEYVSIDKFPDKKSMQEKFNSKKREYLASLQNWVDKLPELDEEKSLNEAASTTPNARKRKAITDFIVNLYNTLEDGGTMNSSAFLENTKKMSDSQFIAYFKQLTEDPSMHLYFEMEAFKYEPTYETVEKAAMKVVGDEYVHLYDYIAFPHLSSDPKHPEYTVHKVFNGYINMRRVQQLVNNKNHIPTEVSQRDPKTDQVVLHSKAARVSDTEQFGMICQGTRMALKEFFGPRGGDPIMRDQMARQIAATGSAKLSEMDDSRFNKTSLNTANVYLTGAGLESDLVTKNGILPRTIQKQYQEARVLNR